jgi:hypothetical protein
MPFVVRKLFASEERLSAVLCDEPEACGTFKTRERAEAKCAKLERELREHNPFDIWQQASLCDLTSLEPNIFCDWLQDAGIEPPKPDSSGGRDWEAWWDESSPHWSDEQREHAWKAMDRVRGFEVVEVKPTRKLYVIMKRGWLWFDEPPWHSDAETMQPCEAYTTREKAEQRLPELNRLARLNYTADDEFEWENPDREEQEGTLEDTPFYEIVEIEEEG